MDVLPSRPRRARGLHRRAGLPRRAVVLGTTGAVVLGVAGVGYAAWTVTASGNSAAASGSPVVGVVTAATPVDKLYPGGSTALYFTVSNPNSFPVTYSTASFGTVSSSSASCSPTDHITTANQSVTVTVAAGQTSSVLTPAGAITMKQSATDACQNVTFTVATTVTGASA